MRTPAVILLALLSCAALPRAADRTDPEPEPEPVPTELEVPVPTWNPDTIPDVAERAVRSVVNVSTKKTVTTAPRMSPFSNDPFFRQFFADPRMQPREQIREGQGSGVVIDADRGLIVTNNHVVDGADEVQVAFSDGQTSEAAVVGTDPQTDLAVLRLDPVPDGLAALSVGDSESLRLGETVLAIGNPFGVGQTVTMGIVSATGRANVGIVDYEDFIQTDAAINPGNSGGALVNLRGELVGINTAIMSRSGGYQGIGFAIPTEMMQPIVDSILDDGTVQRGYLGVMIQDVNDDLAAAMDLDRTAGIVISDVVDGSPADRAGLKTGDVLLRLDGDEVPSVARFRSKVAGLGPDTSVELDLVRNGKTKTVKAKLGLLPGTEVESGEPQTASTLGLTLESLTKSSRSTHAIPDRIRGVVVTEVDRAGIGARVGIRVGDVLTEVNRRPVGSPADVETALKGAGRSLILLYRDGHTRFVVVEP